MKPLCSPLFAALVASTLLCTAQTEAASVPSWTCEVPASTFQSTTSALGSATSDAAGNTFVVISHQGTIEITPGVPIPTTLGLQLLLINAKGKVAASTDLPNVLSITTLLITGKKVLIYTSGSSTVTQLTIGPNATFVSTPLTFQAVGEVPSFSGAPSIERKYAYTSISTGGKVTSLKRYSLSKLKP